MILSKILRLISQKRNFLKFSRYPVPSGTQEIEILIGTSADPWFPH